MGTIQPISHELDEFPERGDEIAFAHCRSRAQSEHGSDPLSLLELYQMTCHERFFSLKQALGRYDGVDAVDVSENVAQVRQTLLRRDALKLERDTWSLIHSLYGYREHGIAPVHPSNPPSFALDRDERRKAEIAMARDAGLQEVTLAVRWLESAANDAVKFIEEPVAWAATLRRLQNKDAGYGREGDEQLVPELDPDSLTRNKHGTLHRDDHAAEERLLRGVWLLIRAGRLEDARELCRCCHQPWRSASLGGGSLLHDSLLIDGLSPVHEIDGNSNRAVWRQICTRIARDRSLPPLERAVYGKLCGDLDAMLLVCETYEDRLWARLSVALDAAIDGELKDNSMSDGLSILRDVVVDVAAQEPPDSHVGMRPLVIAVQAQLLSGDEDGVVQRLLRAVLSSNPPNVDAEAARLLRFAVHLSLYLASVPQLLSPQSIDAAKELMNAYIGHLVNVGQIDLVAKYVATLPLDEQVNAYSVVLSGIEATHDRAHCLALAEEAGLDVAAIAHTVVESIRVSSSSISMPDRVKVDAIQWLCFNPSHRCQAIIQSNALIREFVMSDKMDVVRILLTQVLPADSVAVVRAQWSIHDQTPPIEESNALKELLSWRSYLHSRDTFNNWIANHAKEAGNEAYEAFYAVLTFPGGWLRDQIDGSDTQRRDELQKIRGIVMPDVIFLLLNVLTEMKMHEQVLSLADIIADPVFGIHESCSESVMQRILSYARQSASTLLEDHEDPLGFV